MSNLLKAGYVGIVGLPNAGKSTLVNHLTQAKVAITSKKPQTTRKNIMGILSQEEAQFIFVDSPGFIQAESGLNAFLESEWRQVLEDVDVLVFVVPLDSKKEAFQKTLDMMDSIAKDKVVVITKTDLDFPEREILVEAEMQKRKVRYFKSRRKGKTEKLEISGDLLSEVKKNLPKVDQFYYNEEIYTNQNLREITSEVILENVFRFLNEEIPYETGVLVREFSEQPRIYKIYADVVVSKERYKKMIIGKGGETIKRIGMQSRKSLEDQFGVKIFLDLKVKCREGWNKKSHFLKELGYEPKRK